MKQTKIITVNETFKVLESKEDVVAMIKRIITEYNGGGYIRLTDNADNEIYINTEMVVAII